jgi:hypothetical protein
MLKQNKVFTNNEETASKQTNEKSWAWHAARMREMRNAHSVLVGKPYGNTPLGTPKRGW